MRAPPLHSSVREAEAAFLWKTWWLFPVAGALASLAIGGPFWEWVVGRPISIQWVQLFSLRVGLSALAFLLVPAVWWMGLRLRRPWLLVWITILCVVIGGECLLQTVRIQAALWLAARARLDAGQHFMREVCYVRLEENAGRGDDGSAIVLMGSSQVLMGVDVDLLRDLIRPVPVIRRAMFGMTPLKALAMQSYMPFRAGDICVQYLSEFDFTNQEEFPFAWFRPYASWRTLPEVMRCMSWSVRVRHWRQTADYMLAASFESWRDRDFLRQIAFHFWPDDGMEKAKPPIPDLAAAVSSARATLSFSPAEEKAFHAFARRLAQQHVALRIFEGDVNPSIYSPDRLAAKELVRNQLAALSEVSDYRYISKEAQGLDLRAEHWTDMSHLNSLGRDMLTRRIAQELLIP